MQNKQSEMLRLNALKKSGQELSSMPTGQSIPESAPQLTSIPSEQSIPDRAPSRYSGQQQEMQPIHPQPGMQPIITQPGSQPVLMQPGTKPPIGQHAMFQSATVHPQQQSTTTVVLNMPNQVGPQYRDWSTGLFDCCEDISTCLKVMWLYPCYGCFLSSKLEESCCLPFCDRSWLLALRVKVRSENRIEGSIIEDIYAVNCCSCCVMCQLSREHDYILAHPPQF